MKTNPNESSYTFKIDFYRASTRSKWDEPTHLFSTIKSYLAKDEGEAHVLAHKSASRACKSKQFFNIQSA